MKIKILDNFLNNYDFERLTSLNLQKVSSKQLKVYHNKIKDDLILHNECIDKKILLDLNNNYHSKALNILKEINPAKVSLYDYSEFQIIETGAECKFPTHDDTPNKLLSGVVYLKPNENSGTVFYSKKNGEGKREVDWRVNRAVFFSRKERETWHSYQGDGKSNRIVLVYNLMTNRIKDVFKIENKNYFYGNLRYKLNPYIYKFFKKTI